MGQPLPIVDDEPPPRPPAHEARRVVLLLLLLAAAWVAFYVLRYTHLGRELQHRELVHAWVHRHRIVAPLVFVAAYVLMSILMLPVWPLQLMAGYCFGLFTGIAWCEMGAALGAMLSVRLSRWLVGEWFQARYESRIQRLRQIDQSLGSNGLAVVLAVRLCHVLPFGLSNYLFGLTRITLMDVGLGTVVGNLPAIAIIVAGGAASLRNGRFWTVLIAVNLLLLTPLAWRYRRRSRQ
jgi:uncharacterized membrane protein YdjX (TVP38/TMEM64 family)